MGKFYFPLNFIVNLKLLLKVLKNHKEGASPNITLNNWKISENKILIKTEFTFMNLNKECSSPLTIKPNSAIYSI